MLIYIHTFVHMPAHTLAAHRHHPLPSRAFALSRFCVNVCVSIRSTCVCGCVCGCIYVCVCLCRSGSMAGERIASARRVLQLCLRSLPVNSCFQIVSFGSEYTCLFPEGSRRYDDGTLALATAHVDDMTANMGVCDYVVDLPLCVCLCVCVFV